MKSREISRSKIGPFSLACTDPYIGIGWEYQSTIELSLVHPLAGLQKRNRSLRNLYYFNRKQQ